MTLLSDAIFRTLEKTTLSETAEAEILKGGSPKVGYGQYRFTGSGATTTNDFDALIRESIRRHRKAADELMEKIKDILPDYSGAIPI